jgi:hypothetical protein
MKHKKFAGWARRTLCLIAVASLSIAFASAQLPESSVPANTVKAFKTAAPGAAAQWIAGPNSSYEASFVKEGQKLVYVYDQASQLQQKKVIAPITALPATVGNSVSAAYPKGTVQYAYKVVTRTQQKYYEVQVANAGAIDRMRYDLEGKPLGKTTLAAGTVVPPVQTEVAKVTPPANNATPAVAKVTPPANNATPAAPVVSKPATPTTNNLGGPATIASAQKSTPAAPTKASPPVAMRGESATTNTAQKTTATKAITDDDLSGDLDDMGDLMDDDDLDDLMDDDKDWQDVDLGDDLDDDADLLLDDDLDIDEDLDDDDDDLDQ